MSSPPQEAEIREIDLTREERWVVHHVLTKRADESIDEREVPPAWVLCLFEMIESGENTLTRAQGWKLHDLLRRYVGLGELPETDLPHAQSVAERLSDGV